MHVGRLQCLAADFVAHFRSTAASHSSVEPAAQRRKPCTIQCTRNCGRSAARSSAQPPPPVQRATRCYCSATRHPNDPCLPWRCHRPSHAASMLPPQPCARAPGAAARHAPAGAEPQLPSSSRRACAGTRTPLPAAAVCAPGRCNKRSGVHELGAVRHPAAGSHGWRRTRSCERHTHRQHRPVTRLRAWRPPPPSP